MIKVRVGLVATWVGSALIIGLASNPASAACFEDGVGCTDDHYMSSKALNRLSCENLWTVRNTIFDENGYCFTTRRARRVFSNEDCYISDQAAVPMNSYERSNVAKIVKLEAQRGCS